MLIKNVSERSLRLAEGIIKNGDAQLSDHAASTQLDETSKTTNQHYSPLLRQVGTSWKKKYINKIIIKDVINIVKLTIFNYR